MTDRELLELAAKAAGVADGEFRYVEGYDDFYWHGPTWGLQVEGVNGVWNPLEDDGDALRLAVKLGLAIRVLEKCVFVESDPETLLGQSQYSELEMYGNSDPCTATRRAIVRAAAAIGEAMP